MTVHIGLMCCACMCSSVYICIFDWMSSWIYSARLKLEFRSIQTKKIWAKKKFRSIFFFKTRIFLSNFFLKRKKQRTFVILIHKISVCPNISAEKMVLKTMIACMNQQMAFTMILVSVKMSGKCSVKWHLMYDFRSAYFNSKQKLDLIQFCWFERFFGLISFDWGYEIERKMANLPNTVNLPW